MLRGLRAGLVVTAFLVILNADPVEGQQWARFRGPNGTGESEAVSIPVRWTDKDYRWTAKLPGVGHSSPVVWDDRVVVTAASEEGDKFTVLCLATADGAQRWSQTIATERYTKSALNSYASTTPALDAKHVYATWATPTKYVVAALSLEDGREVWRREFDPFRSEHGLAVSPLVWEDLVVVPNDQDGPSWIIALDSSSGKTRWQADRRGGKDGAAFATPCVFQPEGGKAQLILSSRAHGISALEPRSGKTLWELPVFQFRAVGSPTVAAGLIFATAGVGGVGRQMVAIRPGDPNGKADAKVIYRPENPIPYVPVPVAKGNLVFLWQDRGVVTCLDGPTGKVLWRERVGGDYFSSPIRVADRLYCPTRNGEMVVLAASDHFRQLARFPLGEKTHATPAVAGDTMYVRTLSQLAAIGGKQSLTQRRKDAKETE